MSAQPHVHIRHINGVMQGSAATKSTRLVLEVLCRMSEFDRPEVTLTKEQIRAESRLNGDTVRQALRNLRAEGTIIAVRNALGGRGRAVTYRLVIGRRRASAGDASREEEPAPQTPWDKLSEHFRQARPDVWKAWLSRLVLVSQEDATLQLEAPNAFIADYCRAHLSGPLSDQIASFDPSIQRISFAVAN